MIETCGVEDIAKGVYSWHESKKRFTVERIGECVKWMREHGYRVDGVRHGCKVQATLEIASRKRIVETLWYAKEIFHASCLPLHRSQDAHRPAMYLPRQGKIPRWRGR